MFKINDEDVDGENFFFFPLTPGKNSISEYAIKWIQTFTSNDLMLFLLSLMMKCFSIRKLLNKIHFQWEKIQTKNGKKLQHIELNWVVMINMMKNNGSLTNSNSNSIFFFLISR